MTPRRFETHTALVTIPADILRWADAQADRHEAEWGFEEDVSIEWPLCGWRGAVGMHVDGEADKQEAIIGLIIEGAKHVLACGVTGQELPLAPGTLYILDPMARHGTRTPNPDARLLFVTDSIPIDDRSAPAVLAARLLASAEQAAARDADRQRAATQAYHGIASVRR